MATESSPDYFPSIGPFPRTASCNFDPSSCDSQTWIVTLSPSYHAAINKSVTRRSFRCQCHTIMAKHSRAALKLRNYVWISGYCRALFMNRYKNLVDNFADFSHHNHCNLTFLFFVWSRRPASWGELPDIQWSILELTVQAWSNMNLGCGTYWIRTSDLLRVKQAL